MPVAAVILAVVAVGAAVAAPTAFTILGAVASAVAAVAGIKLLAIAGGAMTAVGLAPSPTTPSAPMYLASSAVRPAYRQSPERPRGSRCQSVGTGKTVGDAFDMGQPSAPPGRGMINTNPPARHRRMAGWNSSLENLNARPRRPIRGHRGATYAGPLSGQIYRVKAGGSEMGTLCNPVCESLQRVEAAW